MGIVSIDVIKLRTSQNKDGDTLTVRLSPDPYDELSRDAILLARPGSQFKMTLTDLDENGNANAGKSSGPAREAGPQPQPAIAAPVSRLTKQAGIACNDHLFHQFLSEHGFLATNPIDTATCVRLICGRGPNDPLESRREIIPGTDAGNKWQDLYSKFVQWRDLPDAA